jgi:hypothetical protein
LENRSGLIVQACLTQASETAEREAAIDMIERRFPGSVRRLTLGADKGYDAAVFIGELRRMCVTPHIARSDALTKTDKRRRYTVDAGDAPCRICRDPAREKAHQGNLRPSRMPTLRRQSMALNASASASFVMAAYNSCGCRGFLRRSGTRNLQNAVQT